MHLIIHDNIIMLSQDNSCYDFGAAFLWLGRLPCRSGSRGGDVAITSPFFPLTACCSDPSLPKFVSCVVSILLLITNTSPAFREWTSLVRRLAGFRTARLRPFRVNRLREYSSEIESYWSVLCEMRIEREGSRR